MRMANKKSGRKKKTAAPAGSRPRQPDRVVVPILAAVMEGRLSKRAAAAKVGTDDKGIRRWLAHEETAAKARDYLAGKYLAEVPMPEEKNEREQPTESDAERVVALETENQKLREIIIDLNKRLLLSSPAEKVLAELSEIRARVDQLATKMEEAIKRLE